jgi:hypothetical protein
MVLQRFVNALFADFGAVSPKCVSRFDLAALVQPHQKKFVCLFVCSQVTRCVKTPGKVSAFMEQEPRKVAAFVWECLGI